MSDEQRTSKATTVTTAEREALVQKLSATQRMIEDHASEVGEWKRRALAAEAALDERATGSAQPEGMAWSASSGVPAPHGLQVHGEYFTVETQYADAVKRAFEKTEAHALSVGAGLNKGSTQAECEAAIVMASDSSHACGWDEALDKVQGFIDEIRTTPYAGVSSDLTADGDKVRKVDQCAPKASTAPKDNRICDECGIWKCDHDVPCTPEVADAGAAERRTSEHEWKRTVEHRMAGWPPTHAQVEKLLQDAARAPGEATCVGCDKTVPTESLKFCVPCRSHLFDFRRMVEREAEMQEVHRKLHYAEAELAKLRSPQTQPCASCGGPRNWALNGVTMGICFSCDEKRVSEAAQPEHPGYAISDAILALGWLDGPVTEAELPEVRTKLAQLLTDTRAFERRRIEQERASAEAYPPKDWREEYDKLHVAYLVLAQRELARKKLDRERDQPCETSSSSASAVSSPQPSGDSSKPGGATGGGAGPNACPVSNSGKHWPPAGVCIHCDLPESARSSWPAPAPVTRTETVDRLCKLLGEVWEHFDPNAHEAQDCLCSKREAWLTDTRWRSSGQALAYIENVVRASLFTRVAGGSDE